MTRFMPCLSIIGSASLMALAYQYQPWLALVAFMPLFFHALRWYTMLIWGMIYLLMVHAFMINVFNFVGWPVAITIWCITAVYFSIFFGVAGWVMQWVSARIHRPWYWLLPMVWPLIEGLKSIGPIGNPHGDVGIAWALWAEWIPLYSVVGHIGVGGVTLAISVLLYDARHKRYRKKNGMIVLGMIVMAMGVRTPSSLSPRHIPVQVIQSGIPQKQKLNGSRHQMQRMYYRQLEQATARIVVLPEIIVIRNIMTTSFFHQIQAISNAKSMVIIFGSLIDQSDYNGAVVVQPNQAPVVYRKRRLMPFGETLPFPKLLDPLIPDHVRISRFKRGTESVNVALDDHVSVRPLICLEGIYGPLYQYHDAPPQVMTILANNAWFHPSRSGHYLVSFARAYAATFQMPVLVSSNRGRSAIINAKGGLESMSTDASSVILSGTVQVNRQPSLYDRWPWFGLGVMGILWGWLMRRRGPCENDSS